MGVIGEGIPRGCQGLFTPVFLGYPLSVLNKNFTVNGTNLSGRHEIQSVGNDDQATPRRAPESGVRGACLLLHAKRASARGRLACCMQRRACVCYFVLLTRYWGI